ncbi:MAG: RecX family transcriptional regulator, partial [Chloroflexota bacterium]
MKITKLYEEGRKKDRFRLYLETRPVLRLEAEVVVGEGLSVGKELSEADVERLFILDRYQKCLKAALSYLGYRPRSELEVRTKLRQRGFVDQDIDLVVAKLKEQGFIDDRAFADFWRENRESFSPRSRYAVALELTRKGVRREVVQEAVSALDDSEGAYRAALTRAQKLGSLNYKAFRTRLGGYLRQRGFSYEVASD